jgi:D-tyrosyl-tRNA(Tyr) deacylase
VSGGVPAGALRETGMKAIIQRVSRASVTVDNRITGKIGCGFLVLLGIRHGDTPEAARFLAGKTAALRVFGDAQDKMNLSLVDKGGSVLVVSQFTLYADTRKGNRPSFVEAAPPTEAERLYGVYVDHLRNILGENRVATGVFRASMQVELVNDGPVTIELSSDARPDEGVAGQGA